MNETLNNIQGIAYIGGFIVLIVLIIVHERRSGKIVQALTEAFAVARQDTRGLDMVENIATKIVTQGFVERFNATAEGLKAYTPDDIDRLIDTIKAYFNAATDGKPNEILNEPLDAADKAIGGNG